MKSAEVILDLTAKKLFVNSKGTRYIIDIPSGRTMVELAGFEIPLSGCPFPADWWRARFWMWAHRNFKSIIVAGLLAISLGMLQVVLALMYPADMSTHFIAIFSYWMNAALIIGFCMVVIALFAHYFLNGAVKVQFGEPEKPAQLSAGAPDISPDVLVMALDENEAPESFESRMNEAFEATEGSQKWVLVVAPKQPTFAVRRNSDLDTTMSISVFLRSKPFDPDPFTESDVMDASSLYQKETFGQYQAYCLALAADFKRWIQFAKIGKTNYFSTMADEFKSASRSTVSLLILAFAFPILLGAQKTEQVRNYLGDRAELIRPESGQEVSFIFERREISVVGNGSRNMIETLQSVPFFSDASKDGRLLAIKVGGKTILPKKPGSNAQATAQAAAQEPVSALPIPGEGESVFGNLPDSTEFERMKGRYLKERAQDWKAVKPALDYYMWRFRFWLILLVGIGGILWVVAKLTARDGVRDYHGIPLVGYVLTNAHLWSKGWLFLIMAIISIPFALEGIITFFYTGTITFGVVFQWAAIALIWYKVWEFILPDTPGSKGMSAGNYPDNYQRRLNG